MVGICEEFAKDYYVTFNLGKTLCMCLGRMSEYPQPQTLLKWHDFAMGEICKAFGKYCYVAVIR